MNAKHHALGSNLTMQHHGYQNCRGIQVSDNSYRECRFCGKVILKRGSKDHEFMCNRNQQLAAATMADRKRRFPHLKPKSMDELNERRKETENRP